MSLSSQHGNVAGTSRLTAGHRPIATVAIAAKNSANDTHIHMMLRVQTRGSPVTVANLRRIVLVYGCSLIAPGSYCNEHLRRSLLWNIAAASPTPAQQIAAIIQAARG